MLGRKYGRLIPAVTLGAPLPGPAAAGELPETSVPG
jgi:hypothetical protein